MFTNYVHEDSICPKEDWIILLKKFLTIKVIQLLKSFIKVIKDLDRYLISYHITPLHKAAKNGSLKTFELLTEYLQDINPMCVNDPDKNLTEYKFSSAAQLLWCTPLHFATENGHTDIVKFILNNFKTNSNFNEMDQSERENWINPVLPMDMRPIHIACKEGHVDIVKLYCNEKIDLNVEYHRKSHFSLSFRETFNSLNCAVLYNQLDVVKILLQHNNLPNYKCMWLPNGHNDTIEATALHLAAYNGNLEIVTLLIEVFTDKSPKAIVKENIEGKRKYNQIDKPKDSLYDGATPLDIAIERGHKDVVKYLKDYLK